MRISRFIILLSLFSAVDFVLPFFGINYNFTAIIFLLCVLSMDVPGVGAGFLILGAFIVELTHGFTFGSIILPFTLLILVVMLLGHFLNMTSLFRRREFAQNAVVASLSAVPLSIIFGLIYLGVRNLIYGYPIDGDIWLRFAHAAILNSYVLIPMFFIVALSSGLTSKNYDQRI